MLPAANSNIVKYSLAIVNILFNLAIVSLSVFTIVYWGRATYRIATKRDWLTGIKEKQIIKAA
jgi:hypothetical protein